MRRNCSRQLALEVRAGSGHRQGGTDPAEELCNFDIFFLRYLRGVKSELHEQAVHISLHQICEGADSGAPSLDNIFPAGTLVFGNFPSLFGFNLSFFGSGIGFLCGASVLIFTSERAATRASSRAAFSFSKEATRSSIPATRETRLLSIPIGERRSEKRRRPLGRGLRRPARSGTPRWPSSASP